MAEVYFAKFVELVDICRFLWYEEFPFNNELI